MFLVWPEWGRFFYIAARGGGARAPDRTAQGASVQGPRSGRSQPSELEERTAPSRRRRVARWELSDFENFRVGAGPWWNDRFALKRRSEAKNCGRPDFPEGEVIFP